MSDEEISACDKCFCMTHTIKGKCGKCKADKEEPMSDELKDKLETEQLARKLHEWYLEGTKKLNPENYNAKAQKSYDELNEEQKEIDRYIAKAIVQHFGSPVQGKGMCQCCTNENPEMILRTDDGLSCLCCGRKLRNWEIDYINERKAKKVLGRGHFISQSDKDLGQC